MPVRLIESNDRIAEVQFFCDDCGKLVRTSLVPIEEIETQGSKKIVCWQCKH